MSRFALALLVVAVFGLSANALKLTSRLREVEKATQDANIFLEMSAAELVESLEGLSLKDNERIVTKDIDASLVSLVDHKDFKTASKAYYKSFKQAFPKAATETVALADKHVLLEMSSKAASNQLPNAGYYATGLVLPAAGGFGSASSGNPPAAGFGPLGASATINPITAQLNYPMSPGSIIGLPADAAPVPDTTALLGAKVAELKTTLPEVTHQPAAKVAPVVAVAPAPAAKAPAAPVLVSKKISSKKVDAPPTIDVPPPPYVAP